MLPAAQIFEFDLKKDFGKIVKETSVFTRPKSSLSNHDVSGNCQEGKITFMKTNYELKKNGHVTRKASL